MKVPLKWLTDHVDLADVPLPELVERLTLAGLEVSGVRLFGIPAPAGLKAKQLDPGPTWDRDKIVTAHIQKIDKHPNADKLKLVTLDYGAAEPKQVVTGAPNIAVGESGQKVILGLRGSRYFIAEEDKATKQTRKVIKTLEPKELRGIPNEAMCMSDFELGISDEHEGIILLEADAPIGVPAADFMGDAVLEIDVLPNMARCLSMIGVAREVASLFGKEVRVTRHEPPASEETVADKVRIEIADATLSARYTAMLVRDVTIGPAPGWLRRRLVHAGMRPINNIVDATNYAMLEWGQPLHAFDYDVLLKRASGVPTISVRPAHDGEKLKTLDGQDRVLTPETLVIADTAGAIALAGVMGGLETEVTAATKNVLLESASFDPVSIRRTAHRFNLFSEASTRFSKGIHPEMVLPTAEHAATLMVTSAGGKVLRGAVDNYAAPPPTQVVALRKTEIRRLLGVDFPDAEVERILTSLQFALLRTDDGWKVTVPLTRLDVQAGAADLIEELARIHGYDRLPSTLLSGELPPQRTNWPLVLEDAVRDLLANAGLQECVTYSLIAKANEAKLGLGGEWIELVNPISPERSAMRKSLLTNLLEAAAGNLRHAHTVRLFEVGAAFLPISGQRLPAEPRRLGLLLTGQRTVESWDEAQGNKPKAIDFFDLKGVVERLTLALHLPSIAFRATRDVPHLHPGRAAELLIDGRVAGSLGELHPKTAVAFELADRSVLVAEIDLDVLLATVPERFAYTPVPEHQAALRDVAVVVDESLTNEAIVKEIRAAGGEMLSQVRLFDVYRGDSIAAGKKSLAYALSFQADRTLKDTEIDKAHKKVEERLVQALGASIRGKE
jgi:phenylalanyl-tRNA synthetase beta chain